MNVGFTDLKLRELFPCDLQSTLDEKLPPEASKEREKLLMIKKESAQNRTVEMHGDIYYFSVRIGSIKMGLRQCKLRKLETDAKN